MISIGRSNRVIQSAGIGFALCAVLLASGCAQENGDAPDGPQRVDRGEQVFDENCGVCHGAEGRGPALAEIRALSSAERRDRIRNHPIAGQIPQRLPANQLADVIEFLKGD